jgi:hypothetical protein
MDLFGVKRRKMELDELKQENKNMLEALTRINLANKEMDSQIKSLTESNKKLQESNNYLIQQMRMREMKEQARTKFSDESKNY